MISELSSNIILESFNNQTEYKYIRKLLEYICEHEYNYK